MATLERIRNKAGLLVSVVLGMALLAFILGDFLRSYNQGKRGGGDEIGEVFGESIRYPEYRNKLDKFIENYKAQTGKTSLEENEMNRLRQEAWDALIKEKISEKEFDEIGLTVSKEELKDMIIGNNIDPGILQAPTFKNEQGIFDRNLVQRYIDYIKVKADEKEKVMWEEYKLQMLENRKFQKYYNLISKSYYITKQEKEELALNANKKVDFDYVLKRYTDIKDEDVKITEDDYKNYYNEHKYLYKQEPAIDVEYVTFDVVPSEDDIKNIEKEMNKLITEFKKTEDGIEFANLNSINPYEDKNYKPGELDLQIDSLMFSADTGFVYGPYVIGNTYKLAKLVAIKMLPDSVKARHILIQPTSQDMTREQFENLVDSVFNLVKNGGDFEKLAEQFSADKKTAMVGGNVGWFKEGQMVKPFEKFCFEGKVGDIDKVNSQYGVHIVEITEQGPLSKRVNVAFVEKELYPSAETERDIYAQAAKFASEHATKESFEKYFDDNNDLTKKLATLKESDNTVAGLEAARELIRWAFNTKEGEFSNILKFGNKYVYAVLTGIKEKGYAKLEDVKEQMEPFILNEKKAEIIKSELKGYNANSLEDLAQKTKTNVESAHDILFNAFAIGKAGFEPDVIAIATKDLKKDEISKPVDGRAGVFVMKLTNENIPENLEVLGEKEAQRISIGFQNQVTYKVFEALEESADVKDYRIKFF